MYFDSAFRSLSGERIEDPQDNVSGIGILFITQVNSILPYSFTLTKEHFNNIGEYDTVITSLYLASHTPIANLTV